MVQIICLANSIKQQERCIAGINLNTGKWIRAISNSSTKDGSVPKSVRLINGKEPALLDILEIPLEQTGSDFGFESENLTIAAGRWQQVGRIQPGNAIKYCDNYPYILHNSDKYVNPSYLKSLSFEDRRTLQLVYVKQLSVSRLGGTRWRGTIVTETGQQLTDISITDPVFMGLVASGYTPKYPCLVTVSLSMPYCPSPSWRGECPCWKLIAAVIELSEFDLILVEMQRLNWSLQRGQDYLQKTYNKRSRQQLTTTELNEFLTYLKSLPTTDTIVF